MVPVPSREHNLNFKINTMNPTISSTEKSQLTRLETLTELPISEREKTLLTAGAYNSEPFLTNNWDTVFAASYSDLNNYITKRMQQFPDQYPTSWTATVPASDFNRGYSGSGTFGPWQLEMGQSASGTKISMKFPLNTCTVVLNDIPHVVSGGIAVVEVLLNLVPTTEQPNHLKLMVKTTTDNESEPILTVDNVTITSSSPAVSGLDGAGGAIANLLINWADKNLSQFQHIFAIVNLNETASKASFQWVKPTYTSYAFTLGKDMDSSYLGVLCMVLNHSPAQTTQELNAGAIPPGSKAGFNISADMFLTQMVMPGLPGAFKNATPTTFVIKNDQIVLAPGTKLMMNPIRHAGLNYTPELQSFTFSIVNEVIEIYTYVRTNISAGIDAYVETTSQYQLQLGVNKKTGGQSITYLPVGTPVQHRSTVIADWVVWTEAIADIVLAVATSVISGLASTIEKIIYRVIVAAIIGGIAAAIAAILEQIPVWIAGEIPDNLPSIDAMITDATNSFQWGDTADFDLTGVNVNGSIQFGGTLTSI